VAAAEKTGGGRRQIRTLAKDQNLRLGPLESHSISRL
jgi:hypothetical protein